MISVHCLPLRVNLVHVKTSPDNFESTCGDYTQIKTASAISCHLTGEVAVITPRNTKFICYIPLKPPDLVYLITYITYC